MGYFKILSIKSKLLFVLSLIFDKILVAFSASLALEIMSLKSDSPRLKESVLISFSELNTKKEIDILLSALKIIIGG